MHFLSTITLITLGLSACNALTHSYGWIAIYNSDDPECKGKYYQPGGDKGKYRPIFGSNRNSVIDWSPADLAAKDMPGNITTFGVNWGTGGIGFDFDRVYFYANPDCTADWLGTLERPNLKYDKQGVMTCFSLDGVNSAGEHRDGRAVQCIKSNRAEGKPTEKGPGIVEITNKCPTGC